MNHNSSPIQKVIDLTQSVDQDIAIIKLQTLRTLLGILRKYVVNTNFYDWRNDLINDLAVIETREKILSFMEERIEIEKLITMSDEDFEKFVSDDTNITKYVSQTA